VSQRLSLDYWVKKAKLSKMKKGQIKAKFSSKKRKIGSKLEFHKMLLILHIFFLNIQIQYFVQHSKNGKKMAK